MTDLIRLQSEPNPPSGTITAEGLLNTMGRPRLSSTEMLLRESLQNSWDAARIPGVQPHYMVRLFSPSPDQLEAYASFFRDRPDGERCPVRIGLEHFFSTGTPVLMEISDRGTVGLGGPTRADGTDAGDFANFLRNIGRPRDTDLGGGTYGFGKSSLYLMSGPQVLIVDTLTHVDGSEQRRLIAHAAGASYSHRGRQFTGRHWWGVPSDELDDFVEPALDGAAAELAHRLGFSSREPGMSGTSLMFLNPRLDDLADAPASEPGGFPSIALRRRIGIRLQEMFLWWCWPKLVRDEHGVTPMRISLDCFGEDFSPPDPESVPQLLGFAESLRRSREKREEDAVRSLRPARLAGHLFITRRSFGALFPDPRWRRVLGDTALIPERMAHIALLRPAELVVRYEVGTANEAEEFEWTGVFRCSEEQEIEEAFALSEPPAHDDWEPSQRLTRTQKVIVNAALKRVKLERLRLSGRCRPKPVLSTEGESVALISRRIGASLIGSGRGAPGGEPREPRLTTAGRRRLRLSRPSPSGTRLEDGRVITSFDLKLQGDSAPLARVSIRPTVQADVSRTEEAAPNGLKPDIVAVMIEGSSVPLTDQLVVPSSVYGTAIRVDVSMPDYVAIGLETSCEELAEEVAP